MSSPDLKETSKTLEADFVKKADSGGLFIDGVVVFSYNEDQFEYLPCEGYEDYPTFGEMTEIEITRAEMDPKDRDTTFIVKTPKDPVGSEAKAFLRVEAGSEREKITATLFYLNQRLGSETGYLEKRRRYRQLLWSHRDVLMKDYLYQVRSNEEPYWKWVPQFAFGYNIKYRKDLIATAADGEMRRVRPKRAESMTSTSSVDSGAPSRAGSFSADQGPRDPEPEKQNPFAPGRTEDTVSFTFDEAVAHNREMDEATSGGETTFDTTLDTSMMDQGDGGGEAEGEAQGEAHEAASDEGAMDVDKPQDDLPPRSPPVRATVDDEEISAQLASIELDNPLSEKLKKYYAKLPKSVEDIPDPKEKTVELKHLVLELRPYANDYLVEINKKKLPTMSVTKPMTAKVAQREYNTIKKAIEDRDKFQDKQDNKRWALAKKKAVNLKRSEMRKAAREKAAEEKKRLVEAAKAKALEQKKAAAEARQSAQDEAAKGTDEESQTASDHSSAEEIMPSGPSKSRSGPAPSPSILKKKSRAKRPYLPDTNVESRFGVILDELRQMRTSMDGMQKDFERQEKNHDRHMSSLNKGFKALVSDTNEIKTKLLRQAYADELKMADLERDVTRFVPFDQVEPGMRFLMGNEFTAKALSAHCWRAIRYAGYTEEADLTIVVNTSAKVLFSNELKAFMKIESDRQIESSTDAVRGWDRVACPEEFVFLMEDYILRTWSGNVKDSRSPKKASAARGWKKILHDHLRNTRTGYFEHIAAPYQFCDEMLNHRHNIKKFMYQRNHDEGQQNMTVPSNKTEKEWFVKDSPNVSSVEDLKTTPVLKKRPEYESAKGADIDFDEIREAAKNLAAAMTGLPEFAAEYFDVIQEGLPKAADVSKAFREKLKQKQGYHDFPIMGIEENEAAKKKKTGGDKEGSKSRSSSVVSGSEAASSKGSVSRPSSPTKRTQQKSPSPKAGGSPQKKQRVDKPDKGAGSSKK